MEFDFAFYIGAFSLFLFSIANIPKQKIFVVLILSLAQSISFVNQIIIGSDSGKIMTFTCMITNFYYLYLVKYKSTQEVTIIFRIIVTLIALLLSLSQAKQLADIFVIFLISSFKYTVEDYFSLYKSLILPSYIYFRN